VSNVHRLRLTDCIFFVNVNLRPRFKRFNESACGEERVGEAPEGWAVVELQQFCFGQGNGGGVSHPD
jgi:hypothetical protein